MNRTLEILREARELISDPNRWAQRHFAVNESGDMVLPDSSHAVKWCAAGAIYKVVISRHATEEQRFAAACALGAYLPDGIWGTNDGPDGYRRVLAGFDKAIAVLEAKQGAPKITIGS